jgi:murein DD-endopeptidase MepM/ murein hydrolase activator NlpD
MPKPSTRLTPVVLLLTGVAALGPTRGFAATESETEISGGFTPPTDEISDHQRDEIRALIERNLAQLAALGRLPAASAPGVQFAWPLVPHLGPEDFSYYGISAHIDEDPNPTLVLDYNCGNRTYDTHRGTDIFLYPFAWNRVDSAAIEVVAGADGIVIFKQDGNPDHNCGPGGNWNGVFLRHPDGSQSWYGHMANGSVTTKNVGDAVVTGEHLGIVASSGSSGGPHLHFEVHDSADMVIDPWRGTCNLTTPDSWWLAQLPYNNSAVNRLMTGFAVLVRGTCPQPDQGNEAVIFQPGNTIWFTRFYRDLLSTQTSACTIYRPDSSVFRTWSSTSSQAYLAAAYSANSFAFGATEPLGKWRFEVIFDGTTYNHDFWLVGAGPWLLRNARLTSAAPPSAPLSSIFVGTGNPTLDLGGRDAVPRPGEGDDDDAYVPAFTAGQDEPDTTVVGNQTRPLVFYQLDAAAATLKLAKNLTGGLTLFY